MMGFGGMGLGVVGLLLMILLWGGVIALAVWLVGVLFPQAKRPGAASGHELTAREILDRRYARGEIGRQEYELMRETLSDRVG